MTEPPPIPTPMVFRCSVCGAEPVKLIGAKWKHPTPDLDQDHVAQPVQVIE